MPDNASLTARFGLLAACLTGRQMVVAGGTEAWTDGKVVHVDPAEDVRRQVVLQAALIRGGGLAPRVTRQLVGRPALARRYLALEGRRALATLGDVLPAGAVPTVDPLPMHLSCPADCLAVARSRDRVPDAPPWFGRLRPHRIAGNAELLDPAPTVSATAPLPPARPPSEAEIEAPSEPETKPHKASRSWTSRVVSPLAQALRRPKDPSHGSAEAGTGGEAGLMTAVHNDRPPRSGIRAGSPMSWQPAPVLRTPRVRLYPEWDEGLRAYRPDWCSVTQYVPGPDELAPLPRPARHDGLRRALAPVGLGMLRHRRQPGGHDLDLDAAVEARIIAVGGRTPPAAVYLDNLRRRRELTVLVLLDASGSTNEVNSSGSLLYERQRDAAAALIDTLHILGDRVAGYAFRSRGRDVTFTTIKTFDEPFGAHQMARLGGLCADGFTRLGAAIRHATHLLATDRACVHRVLVVVTDGFPYDTGYEDRYAEVDARKALAEARAAGVGCLGLDLASATAEDLLERVFGATLHAGAADIDALAPAMPRLLIGALDDVARQRRKGVPA